MIFSIHQPNYIPYLGYFYKIAKSDVFVILDIVQFPRGQNYSPRNKIKTPQGTYFLSIPVKVPKGKEGKASYTEITFADDKWPSKHLKTVEQNYKKAAHFKEVFNIYDKILQKPYNNLAEVNTAIIREFCSYLQINTRIVILSDLLTEFGQKTDLIIDIAKVLKANKYLSGTGGGKEYNDETKMNEYGIELLYSKFIPQVYKQLWGDFIPNLSVLDVLFNNGKSTIQMIK